MFGNLVLIIAVFAAAAYFIGRWTSASQLRSNPRSHSRPVYHGAFLATLVALPALLILLAWASFQGTVIDRIVLGGLPPEVLAGANSAAQTSLLLSQIKNVAAGQLFGEPAPAIAAAAERLVELRQLADWTLLGVLLVYMVAALVLGRMHIGPRFRARNTVEMVLSGLMLACSLAAIATTVGIALSLVFESWRFFQMVPLHEFLFGLRWEPQIAIRPDQVAGTGAFGIVPVFVGTLLISAVAMAVATPIGIYTAIYLVEFADRRVRGVVKPILELLAGIPTVVYGFFAVLTVAPAIRDAGGLIGIAVSPNSALAAGGVMGIMLIPFISSISDDALQAVPRSLRDASLAMGATRGETVNKVLVPAALPGIMGGVLLAVSRAIGETMIVVMAAGLIASLTFNPIDSVTTVTVQIVTLLIGDTEFDSPKTLAAFALGLMLFLVTLVLNVVALAIVRRYREQYD